MFDLETRIDDIEKWISVVKSQIKQYERNESLKTEIEKNTTELLTLQQNKIKKLEQRIKELEGR